MTKIQCISDLHGKLSEGIDCDLLLIAGDICPIHNHQIWFQKQWLEYDFINWLKRQKYDKAIMIAGNHDFVFEHYPIQKYCGNNLIYLQDDSYLYDNLKIYGSPWQPEFGGWAFNLPEEKLAEKWLTIPEDCDILLLHGPPKGFGCAGLYGAGSQSLTDRIAEIQPKLVVCGHIHEGYGEYEIGQTKVINVSSLDEYYKIRKNPIWTINL